MSTAIIERDEEIDLILTALLAQEHPLLVDPPGTAKSLLLDSLMEWMNGKRFSILLTKFGTPKELFGPLSVSGLKVDRNQRITTGKRPEADLAFVDAIWKASSAILNTLLRILNERTIDNGNGKGIRVPLKMFLAANNDWPHAQEGGKELIHAPNDRGRTEPEPLVRGSLTGALTNGSGSVGMGHLQQVCV